MQAQAAGVAYSHPLSNLISRMAYFGPRTVCSNFCPLIILNMSNLLENILFFFFGLNGKVFNGGSIADAPGVLNNIVYMKCSLMIISALNVLVVVMHCLNSPRHFDIFRIL